MKQVFQNLSDGDTELVEVPIPSLKSGEILIQTDLSLISPGTERMLTEFGKLNLLDKAKNQPDKVKDVVNKIKNDGLFNTFEAVKSKLDTPIPLGYSNVGKVIDTGENVTSFKKGDRVVSNGPHAEIISIPQNLVAKIPAEVTNQEACFTIIGSIALQGIRLAKPTLGETIVVTGLGLVGLITIQLLQANGCDVIGIDPDPKKQELAKSLGIETCNLSDKNDIQNWFLSKTNSTGVDAVIITATTASNDPIDIAASISRTRGRIILVGVVGLNIRRDLFYKKEISFQVSCSYGPGRYDEFYETKGLDYPIGFVRWTLNRNFKTILFLLKNKKLKVDKLISEIFNIKDVGKAYEKLSKDKSVLGIIFKYDIEKPYLEKTLNLKSYSKKISNNLFNNKVSFIGSGNYASRILIPAFKKAGAEFNIISASNGFTPTYFGRKFNFRKSSTNIDDVVKSSDSNIIVICTRHNSHSELIIKALSNDKNVFVEKPLCLNLEQLERIKSSYESAVKRNKSNPPILMVGFNRRFAPLIQELKILTRNLKGPFSFVYTCNAGSIPSSHWTQDPNIGGGRLIGEACHFVDLIRYLVDSPIEKLSIFNTHDTKPLPDTFTIQLIFKNGSIGTVHYFANGSKSYPKERLEVYGSGKIFVLDNFRKLSVWGIPGFITKRNLRQDKGQNKCVDSFMKSISNNSQEPINVTEIFEVHELLFKASNLFKN